MAFPGFNILALANRAISPQTVQYRPYVTRTLNPGGLYEATWAAAKVIKANLQPVPRTRYEIMGLDFQKNYAMVYVEKNVIDIAREVTGDQFWYAGRLYEAESKTSWFAQDGWDSVLCCEVPGYTAPFPIEEVCCSDA